MLTKIIFVLCEFKICSSSSEEDDFEEVESDDSDCVGGRRKKSLRPVRRSTRVRVSRYDADFSKYKCLHPK